MIWKSLSKGISHINSQTTDAIALYSASAEDLETVCCFFDFQDIKESPRNTQYSVIGLLISRQLAQSESEKDFRCKLLEEEKNNPYPGDPLIYLRTLSCCEMGSGWFGHILTQFFNIITKIWSCHNEVEKPSN